MRKYRLEIKQRLYKMYDLVSAYQDSDDRKKKLEELYSELHQEYMKAISKNV